MVELGGVYIQLGPGYRFPNRLRVLNSLTTSIGVSPLANLFSTPRPPGPASLYGRSAHGAVPAFQGLQGQEALAR